MFVLARYLSVDLAVDLALWKGCCGSESALCSISTAGVQQYVGSACVDGGDAPRNLRKPSNRVVWSQILCSACLRVSVSPCSRSLARLRTPPPQRAPSAELSR